MRGVLSAWAPISQVPRTLFPVLCEVAPQSMGCSGGLHSSSSPVATVSAQLTPPLGLFPSILFPTWKFPLAWFWIYIYSFKLQSLKKASWGFMNLTECVSVQISVAGRKCLQWDVGEISVCRMHGYLSFPHKDWRSAFWRSPGLEDVWSHWMGKLSISRASGLQESTVKIKWPHRKANRQPCDFERTDYAVCTDATWKGCRNVW